MSDSQPPTVGSQGDTALRILDATLACISRHGVRRLTLEDVASAAEISRQTVYRHFGSRDQLLEAVILREETTLLKNVEEAVADALTLEEAIRVAFLAVLRAARAHPLLDRLLEEEPGALLPHLALGRGPVLSAAEPVVRSLLARFLEGVSDDDIWRFANAATRLVVSYALAPEMDPETTADAMASLLVRGVGGHREHPDPTTSQP